MPRTAIVKFCKLNDFGHNIFVSSQEIDIKSYFDFEKLNRALKTQYPNDYLHVYKPPDNDVYFVQCQKFHPMNFRVNVKYEINFTPVIRKKRNGQSFVSLVINTAVELLETHTEFSY